ncbi:nitroreductase [Breznakibacter xylanolyticus]|uniref:Nitroreductase n=1 Tax=Breznakibacter xylanolyticus TaxID=990 RepID=A0A2W7NUI0_9BACT|nr:NAD(P)H-dependent oxidoreductase [Breznakibacter xylanolyticus]MBN2742623.1 NAD(P)H-dependent oxidoreductase [Marinilabiliaceae bacterium]PZX20264.1 nitroreductase [Breznakibacter xylanolyticus]
MLNAIKQLQWRYATKKFDSSKKLSAHELETILEAANLAPTSMGLQPFKLFVVERDDVRHQLRQAAWDQPQVTDASHVIVFAVRRELTAADADAYLEHVSEVRGVGKDALADYRNMLVGGIESKTVADRRSWAARQAYISLGVVLTVCAIESIDACPMEGFDTGAFDKILGLEEKGWASVVMVTVGTRHPDDKYQHLPKVRKALKDFVSIV